MSEQRWTVVILGAFFATVAWLGLGHFAESWQPPLAKSSPATIEVVPTPTILAAERPAAATQLAIQP